MSKTAKPRAFGSIRKLPSGRYQAGYLDDDGKRINAPLTFPNKRDAEDWLATKQSDKIRGIKGEKPKDPRTIAVYLNEWLETRTVNGEPLAPTTASTYRRYADQHILPKLGGIRVVDLKSETVRSWYSALPNKVGPYRLLRAAMATAVEDELITVNPCKVKHGAKQSEPTRNAMSVQTILGISENVEPRYQAMVLVGCFAGLRIGELAGLQRQDIDFANRIIHVRRQRQYVNKTWIVCPPKAKKEREAPPMPDDVWEALAAHVETFVDQAPTSWVFTTRTGRAPMRTAFRGILQRAAKSHTFPHELRHTGAILLAEEGATPGEMMKWFGWSKMETAAIYLNKARDERRSVLAERMNAKVAA